MHDMLFLDWPRGTASLKVIEGRIDYVLAAEGFDLSLETEGRDMSKKDLQVMVYANFWHGVGVTGSSRPFTCYSIPGAAPNCSTLSFHTLRLLVPWMVHQAKFAKRCTLHPHRVRAG